MPRVTAEPTLDTRSEERAQAGQALQQRIAALLPGEAGDTARLLVVGALPEAVRALLPAGCTVSEKPPGQFTASRASSDDAQRTTAVLMLDDAPSDGDTAQRLGSACREFPVRVVVWQRDGVEGNARQESPLQATHFFAQGFRCLLVAEADGLRHAIYEYRLADYKRAPDWLNARFWANPERFGAAD